MIDKTLGWEKVVVAGVKQFDPQEALDQATELFQRKGFAATSMQDIVDTLGVGRGSLYQTFGGKEALYQAAFENYCTSSRLMMQAMLEGAPSAKEGLRALLMGIVEKALDPEDRRGCLVGNTVLERTIHDPVSERAVAEAMALQIDVFHQALIRAQEEGDLPPERDPLRMARLFITSVQGLILMAIAMPDPEVIYGIAEDAFAALFPLSR